MILHCHLHLPFYFKGYLLRLKSIEIGYVFDAILYKRSSFPGIPFGMPYSGCFVFNYQNLCPF